MPPFYYRRRWNRYRTRRYRRRPWIRTWRPRQTIFRRFHRRRRVRKRRFFTKRKRKLKKITVRQWQPSHIRKCRIKGQLCLLTCGINRINNNYTLTSESYVPVFESGGGGWSIMQLTLRALYDEYEHYRNWWTNSNCGLPLVRYNGCKFKFYNSNDCDYIVTPQHTGPFEVTRDTYLNTQPSRHMMNHQSFIVPKLNPNKKKRPYITKRFPPPALFQSKWYFQQDILNTPLILLTVSSCSLDQMYAPNDQISTNITFNSLNTTMFQNPYWETEDPYYCKVTGTINTGLYTYANGNEDQAKSNWTKLQPLANTTRFIPPNHNTAEKITTYDKFTNKNYFANPFATLDEENAHHDIKIYYGQQPTQDTYNKPATILETTLFQQCRYNPFKDKGIGNKVYLKCTKTQQGSFLSIPTDPRLTITDFPLWLVFWGWPSWLEKSKPVHHIPEDYQFVIQSPYIYPPMPCYVPLDNYFTHPKYTILTETDKQHWHPKAEYQTEVLAKFAETGPAATKINKQKQIQIHAFYNFYFKWGGCPAPMETICNPADQEKFPMPNNFIQQLTLENPETQKEHYIYTFDERDGLLTKPAAKRLKKDHESPKYFTEFGTKDPILQIFPPTQETQEKTTPEKTEELQQQLQLLRDHQHQLRERIHRLKKRSKYYPMT
nr:MAG: ORF1 [TTV-like mini virus]